MFHIVDTKNNSTPVKSGFKTSSQANNWAKKNLPRDKVHLWGEKIDWSKHWNGEYRYLVRKK